MIPGILSGVRGILDRLNRGVAGWARKRAVEHSLTREELRVQRFHWSEIEEGLGSFI